MNNPHSSMPVLEFYEGVYRPSKYFKDRPRCKDPYLDSLSQLRDHLSREPVLADLTTETITAFMQAIVKSGRSPSTANSRMRHLKSIARFAVRRRMLEEAFDVDKFRVPRRLPVAWSVEEFEAMLRASREMPGKIVGVPARKWWPALLLVLYDTGLRRSAALGIRFDEFDFTRKTLRVPAERMKNSVEQIFFLHDQTIEAIVETLPPSRELLFPWPYKGDYSKSMNRGLRSIVIMAGYTCGKRDLFHKIRRTCATQIALKHGEHVAIQQLGHLSPGTIKSYIDPRFLAFHSGARGIPRPDWGDRQIVIDGVMDPERPIPVSVLCHIALFRKDLDGAGRDAMSRLMEKQQYSALDVLDILRALRASPAELADAIGISRSLMHAIVKGNRRVSRDTCTRLRVGLGMTFTYNRLQETKAKEPQP